MHGGDIYRNKVADDFSVNVNPAGMPPKVRDALMEAVHHVAEYPDLQHGELREALSEKFGLPRAWFVLGNGASELIPAILRQVQPGSIMITAPSYLGYRVAISNTVPECRLLRIPLLESDNFQIPPNLAQQILQCKPELLILTNPNNPTGQRIPRRQILEIAAACKQVGCLFLLDECFMTLTGRSKEDSMLSRELSEFPNLVVLRAFTKTYAIPGVRLGYAVCSDGKFCLNLRRQLPEWNLSVFAERAGVACLQSIEYLEESIQMIQQERKFLQAELTRRGFKVYPSVANYLMFQTDCPNLGKKLLDQGILIRSCGDYEGLDDSFYRIAVLDRERNQILLDRISQLL